MSNSPIDGGIVGAASPVPSAGGYNNTKPLKWPLLNLRDCYTDPPTHRRTLDEAEAAFWRYEAMLRSVSKSGRAHLESIRVLVEKHRLFSEDLLRTSRVLSDGDAEWDSFQNRLTDELESYRSMYTHYAELTNNVVLASLDKLVADTAPGIKDARKRFNQASEAADAALDKYLDRKAGDGAIPKSAKEVAAARKTFHEAALTFATRLNAAAAARKPELMTRTFEWLGISVSLHSQTIGLLNQLMKPRVEQFQTAAGRASADAQSQMAKAEALRAKLLLNADNSYDPLQKGMFDAFKGPSPPTKSASPALRASSPADTHESDDWDVVDRPPDEQVFRAGYLLKKNQGQRMRVTTWSRRYFTIRGELLVYQSRDKEEEPTVAVNLRLSTVKACEPAAGERRFAFQIISSSKQYTLQAESEEDMSAWIDALQKAIGGALFATSPDVPMLGVGNGKHKHKLSGSVSGSIAAGGSALSASSGNGTMEVSPAILEANRATANHRARVAEILATAGNVVCGDCGQSDPEWAAINLGVVLCIECSGIHRGFGTAVSKTRSLILDKWDDEIVGIMCALGNDAVNAVYLHRQAGVIGIEPSVDRATREAYLRKKYVAREWVDRDHVLAPLTSAQSAVDGGGPPSTHEAFWDAIRAGALPRALALLAVGAVVDWQHPTHAYRTALHEAIRAGNNVAAEFLLQWGASPSAADRDGWTPVHYAASAANSSMIYRLVGRAGAPHDAKDVRGQTPLDVAMAIIQADPSGGDKAATQTVVALQMSQFGLHRDDVAGVVSPPIKSAPLASPSPAAAASSPISRPVMPLRRPLPGDSPSTTSSAATSVGAHNQHVANQHAAMTAAAAAVGSGDGGWGAADDGGIVAHGGGGGFGGPMLATPGSILGGGSPASLSRRPLDAMSMTSMGSGGSHIGGTGTGAGAGAGIEENPWG